MRGQAAKIQTNAYFSDSCGRRRLCGRPAILVDTLDQEIKTTCSSAYPSLRRHQSSLLLYTVLLIPSIVFVLYLSPSSLDVTQIWELFSALPATVRARSLLSREYFHPFFSRRLASNKPCLAQPPAS